VARIDDLLLRVTDPQLRAELHSAVDEVRRTKDFGLVFESHLPETCRLASHPIRRGVKVTERFHGGGRLWSVTKVDRATADVVLIRDYDGSVLPAEQTTDSFPLDELVVVAEFGDPIYPGLKRVGGVQRGDDKPAHVVINAENYHALEALQFTHAGKVDCIYIDPPYNTGARDWKYNNDYVDTGDSYRHSKWLSFMERRLQLAEGLLNPADSVLIVTIDEKEVHRLALLLEQTFPGCVIQMVSITINPKGTSRPRQFSRVDEYAFFVLFGEAGIPDLLDISAAGALVRWRYLRREDMDSVRGTRPRQFYPVFVDPSSCRVIDVGDPIAPDVPTSSVTAPNGLVAVFPVREDGLEMEWGLTGSALMKAAASGFARATPGHDKQPFIISYLTAPNMKRLEAGEIQVTGEREDGSKLVTTVAGKASRPRTVWSDSRHSAGDYGTQVLSALLPSRRFPFPKSLYAVEDTLRVAVGNKPDAVVVDFFAGSATTAHAVMRLNRQDGGRRQAIIVSNNEVSPDEQKVLVSRGLAPGDPEWESQGICRYITQPRVEAAITGRTPDGEPIKGDYKFVDEFPMAQGFEENAEFFDLTYQDAALVELDMAFEAVAPLLWMRAGGRGPIIEQHDPAGWAWTDAYGVLWDTDRWQAFVTAAPADASAAFIVTDSATQFATISPELPAGVESVRLYENYLTTFQINRAG
jgi:adenine-specific DNA-methyltransferase